MNKFYEVSKVLNKHTDAHCRVQYLVCWRGYSKKYDSWVNKSDTNERLKQVFGTPPRNARLAADLGSVSCREAQYEETANNQHRETCVCYHANRCQDL